MIKWSILMPTMPSRRSLRRRILMLLEPQLEKYDDIELLIFEDNCKRNYGSKLQTMVNMAQGEYLNFIDDDDMVSEKYIDTLYPLLDGVDCVGFTGHISINDDKTLPVHYNLKYKTPENRSDGYFRYIQHLNPIRSELVRQIPYDGHFAADTSWSSKAQEMNLLETQNTADGVLYYYLASTTEDRDIWK